MTIVLHHRRIADEYRAAIARLDADLQILDRAARESSTQTRNRLALLRRRIVSAYGLALADSAGKPDDTTWRTLGELAASFISSLPNQAAAGSARRAALRVRALARDCA